MIFKQFTTFLTIIVFSAATVGCSSTPDTSPKSSGSTTSEKTDTTNKNTGAGQMSTGSQVGIFALKLIVGIAISAAIANAAKKKTESSIKNQIQNALGN